MKSHALLLVSALTLLAATGYAADWPQWRGPNRDDVSKETGLLQKWPEKGPKLLWMSKEAGVGLSGPAIVGKLLYTMGAEKEIEYIYAFDVEDNGKQVWKVEVGPIWTLKGNIWGDGPRSTPTVDGDRVYALGGQGILVCADTKGKKLWSKDIVKDFGGQIMVFDPTNPPPNWGYCESVLVDGDKVVCCPGGDKGLMIALDKVNGNTLWRTTDLKAEASDGSMIVAELGGVRQYVQTFYNGSEAKSGGCVGVSTKDGKILWSWTTERYHVYALTPTPILYGDSVCLSVSQDKGTDLLKITKDDKDAFKVEELYPSKVQRKTLSNTHGGVVLVGKHLYGYSGARGWCCYEVETGKEAWSDRNRLPGKTGSLTYADGHLYLLGDDGDVVLLKASPEGWNESGRFKLPEEAKSRETRKTSNSAMLWTHPVVANGRLYLRDQELLFCYLVK